MAPKHAKNQQQRATGKRAHSLTKQQDIGEYFAAKYLGRKKVFLLPSERRRLSRLLRLVGIMTLFEQQVNCSDMFYGFENLSSLSESLRLFDNVVLVSLTNPSRDL